MPYSIFHVFKNTPKPKREVGFKFKFNFIEKLLLKLGLVVPVLDSDSALNFSHSIISPAKLQEAIKDQVTLLRANSLEPLCIYIGSRDYVDLCEFADFHIIEQVSYVDQIHLLEEVKRTSPFSNYESSFNLKAMDILNEETQHYINRQFKRIPGSLIISGYKFLNLPLIILPWLSGVFVAPSLNETPPSNTTFI